MTTLNELNIAIKKHNKEFSINEDYENNAAIVKKIQADTRFIKAAGKKGLDLNDIEVLERFERGIALDKIESRVSKAIHKLKVNHRGTLKQLAILNYVEVDGLIENFEQYCIDNDSTVSIASLKKNISDII